MGESHACVHMSEQREHTHEIRSNRFSGLDKAKTSLTDLTRNQWRLLALRYQRIKMLYEQCVVKGGAAAGGLFLSFGYTNIQFYPLIFLACLRD